MNTTIPRLKEYCQRASSRTRPHPSSEHRNARILNRESILSFEKQILHNFAFERELFLVIHFGSIGSQASVRIKTNIDDRVENLVIREGCLFYNGQETSHRFSSERQAVVLVRYHNDSVVDGGCINAKLSAFGRVGFAKARAFEDQTAANKYVHSLMKRNQDLSLSQVLKFNPAELCCKAKKLCVGKSRSINVRRKSSLKDENITINLMDVKPHPHSILSELKNLEHSLLNSSGYKLQPRPRRDKNHSDLINGKKNYKSLYESLKNNTFVKSSTGSTLMVPKSKEDIERVYEQERRRFEHGGDQAPSHSQVIEEDIHKDYFYDDSDVEQTFRQDPQEGEASESELAVSQYE